jgi:hypothetical protein
MLDAIADFWKPVKRLQAQNRLKSEELQIGSVIGFGFVPQPSLSGRRLTVTAINTYKFGPDILTSFVLSQDKDAGASMIIAETGGEHYIAMSRRMSISDRNKLFVHEEIEAVIKSEEAPGINCSEVTPEYKGWIAPHYKRELWGVKGQLYKGDHRAGLVIGASALDFAYTLLVSDNNEHALEIEHYEDGRVEVYATVYRRMSDVGEVSHPSTKEKDLSRPEVKLVSNGVAVAPLPESKPAPKLGEGTGAVVPEKKLAFESKAPEVKAPEAKAPEVRANEVKAEAETTPIKLPEFAASDVAKKAEEPKPLVAAEVPKAEAPRPEFIRKTVDEKPSAPPAAPVAAPIISASIAPAASAPESKTPIRIQANTQPYIQQEIKAVNKETSNFVNESIDCELQVANKIIDEAIRQEMRINDVVRRVIGLPVSQQESVQIPVTLTDQDYSLLAIRYGISAGDHEAIKRRITEDLADFSGANRQKKAA